VEISSDWSGTMRQSLPKGERILVLRCSMAPRRGSYWAGSGKRSVTSKLSRVTALLTVCHIASGSAARTALVPNERYTREMIVYLFFMIGGKGCRTWPPSQSAFYLLESGACNGLHARPSDPRLRDFKCLQLTTPGYCCAHVFYPYRSTPLYRPDVTRT
jgi:hypothetical protein